MIEAESAHGTPPRTLVLGIGNLLWADEGFGVRAIEAFHEAYVAPENVTVLDGGTQGLYLLDYVVQADRLLVFDAIDYGLRPGTIEIVENEEVPKFTGAKKMSLHQTGFQEVLSAADLLGRSPSELVLIGCQPLVLEEWGGPLSEPVRNALAPAVAMGVAILTGWGAAPSWRSKTCDAARMLANDLDFRSYERRQAWGPPPLE